MIQTKIWSLALPIFLSCENDGYITRHSRALVSVAAALFLFKRRLTDTYDLGNLPKIGTGFVGIHASLREIPEGDEKYSRWRSLFFYRSRMTKWGVIFLCPVRSRHHPPQPSPPPSIPTTISKPRNIILKLQTLSTRPLSQRIDELLGWVDRPVGAGFY